MTDASDEARKKAGEDLQDIGALRKSEPFQRYWMGRLLRKIDAAEKKLKYEPVEKCGADEREITRRIMLAYEELAKTMEQDEASARALLQPTQARSPQTGAS